MGRFYKTDKPQMLDYMYKLPEQYMLGAVQQASEDITQNQAAMFDLYGKLQLNALDPDKPRAREILDKYEQHINRLSTELQQDPLSFRKRTGDIMALSRDFEKEFTRGEAAAIQGNYNAYQKWVDDWEKIGREKQLDNADWLNNLGAFNLEQYRKQGGVKYDKGTGKYNQIQMDELVKSQDIDAQLSTIAKEYEPEIQAWANAGLSKDGNFIIESGGKTERKNARSLLSAMTDQILSNENVGKYILQGSQIDKLQGYYDKDGKFIEPWVEKDGKIQFQGTLGEKLKAAVEKFAYNNKTDAYERWKNVSKDSGSSKVNGLGHAVNTKTGEIGTKVSPFYHKGTDAQLQVDSQIKSLTSESSRKLYLNDVLQDDIDGVASAMMADGVPPETAKSTISKLKLAVNEMAKLEPDYDMISKTLDDIDQIVDVQPYKDAYTALHEKQMDAYLLGEQNKYYKAVAQRTGTPLDDVYSKLDESKIEVVSSQGAWYDKDEQDAKVFYKALESIANQYDSYAQLDESFVVYTYENGVPKAEMTTREDFLKNYEFVKGEGESNEQALNARISAARGGLQALQALENSTDKNKSDIENDPGFFMINGALPYKDGDDAGEYQQPFQLRIKDKNGKKVSIIIPRTNAPADVISYLDGKYSKKYKLERRLEKIATTINPLIDSTDMLRSEDIGRGIPIWIDKNKAGKEYGLFYVPNLTNSKQIGQVTVVPEEGTSFPIEADKAIILDYYEQLYGRTPLDKD